MLEKQFALGTPFSTYTYQIWRRYLDRWRRHAPKTEFETCLWRRNSTSGSNFDTCFATFICMIVQNFSQTTHRLMTAPNTPLTRPSLNRQSADPETPKWRNRVLPIANLMANSESISPVSYSSFLVTICLSRLVSEIFAYDRQTGRQRDPHIVAAPFFCHIARMPCIAPVHQALRCQVDLSLGRFPDRSWKRRPGRPTKRRLDQIRGDSQRSPADGWRDAVRTQATQRSLTTTRQ